MYGNPWVADGGPCAGHGSDEQRRTCSFLVAARDILIGLLLVVVKIVVLPLPTWALLPGTLWMMQRRLLPPSMLRLVHIERSRLVLACMHRMVHLGRTCLIKSYVAGDGRAF